MSVENHTAAAARLVRIEGEVKQLLELLQDRDGIKARVLDRCLRIHDLVDAVRVELEAVLFKHHPEATTDTYYPRIPAVDPDRPAAPAAIGARYER
jgi:hypothetical protein